MLLPKVSANTRPIHQDQKKKNVVSAVQATKPAALASEQPAPTAVAAPVIPASFYTPDCQAYLPLVQQYPWPVSTAMAIMQAESGCRAITPDNSAINWDHVPDYGLFQLHGMDITDPAQNVAAAYNVKYVGAGDSFRPWSTYTSGAYLKYLQ